MRYRARQVRRLAALILFPQAAGYGQRCGSVTGRSLQRPGLPGRAGIDKVLRTFALALCLANSATLLAQVPGSLLKDCDNCPELVVVPAGEFRMGTPAGLPIDNETGESPPVQITIPRPFAIGRFEVTRAEFGAFADATGFKPIGRCRVWSHTKGRYDDDDNRTWRQPGVPTNPLPRHPVSCVSWEDAQRYVEWLRVETGLAYRLPSEAEWEYTARAGSDTLFPWGNSPHQGCAYVNGYDIMTREAYPLAWTHMACRDGFPGVAPVGSKQPNAFGIYDMLGNVWEFAQDCATRSHLGRPKDGRAWEWQGGCARRIQRGGGWITSVARIRPGYHGDANATHRFDFGGIRIARDLLPHETRP